jgi:hypothetical protein
MVKFISWLTLFDLAARRLPERLLVLEVLCCRVSTSTLLAGNQPVDFCFPRLWSSPSHQPFVACWRTWIMKIKNKFNKFVRTHVVDVCASEHTRLCTCTCTCIHAWVDVCASEQISCVHTANLANYENHLTVTYWPIQLHVLQCHVTCM